MHSRLFILPSVFCLIISVSSLQTSAQADISSSTLTGKVVDASGAAIQSATIAVIRSDRGVARTAKSDDEGKFRVLLLQPGTYELRVAAQGFQTQLLKNVLLTVGQIAVADIQLQVGALTEELDVSASPTLVETERTQQSDTVERRQITALPNLSRNFTSYIFTLPGVADVSAARVQQTRAIGIPTSGFSVGAGNGRGNYVSIDGGENDSGTGNLRVRNLSVEAVQEFQVNRNAFAAEYGFTASTAVNVVTRGGTNAYRGSGYLFYRSQNTSARDPLNTTGEKAFEQRISPGFTFSGPLVKKKAFFFSSFEALKYDVARLRSYTSNTSILAPTGAQSAYLQTLTSGPLANERTRLISDIL